MKNLVLILLMWLPLSLFAQDNLVHSSTSYVDDYAHLFTPEQAQSLDHSIRAFKEKSKVEISVITIDSIGDEGIEAFTIKLARRWGVGSKANQGIMVLVSLHPHGLRTEVGTGLEGDLTDLYTHESHQKYAIPFFKENKYAEGITDLVNNYIQYLDPTAKQQRKIAEQKDKEEQEKMLDALGEWTMNIIGLIGTIGLGVFLVKWRKKVKIRKAAIIKQSQDDFESAYAKLYHIQESLNEAISFHIPGAKDLVNEISDKIQSTIIDFELQESEEKYANKNIPFATKVLENYFNVIVESDKFKFIKLNFNQIKFLTSFLLEYSNYSRIYLTKINNLENSLNSHYSSYPEFKSSNNVDFGKLRILCDATAAEIKKLKEFTENYASVNVNELPEKLNEFRIVQSTIKSNHYELLQQLNTISAIIDQNQNLINTVNSGKSVLTNNIQRLRETHYNASYITPEVKNSIDYLQNSILSSYIAGELQSDSYKNRLNNFNTALNKYNNVLTSCLGLKKVIDDKEAAIQREAQKKEDNRREEEYRIRRKKEQDEEDSRRSSSYNSYSSYSSSESNSSSSSSSNSDFGGGSFSGGGSSDSW
jgi:uncharacterized membrane protein YgcG